MVASRLLLLRYRWWPESPRGRAGEAWIGMAIARKHHYVPQMYLTGFANDNDQCFVVDASTRKSFTSTTANIAAERDYNKIEAQGVPADALEKELGKLEGGLEPGGTRVRESASV